MRTKIRSTHERLRLAVFRSNKYVYAQIIDDQKGKTVAAASEADLPKAITKQTKMERAMEVGKVLAEKAKGLKINRLVFDRRKYKFHGRVKALAEAVRAGGLKF